MIGYLRGKILESSAERLLLDVGGVGYQLAIPLSTFSEIDRATPPQNRSILGLIEESKKGLSSPF